MMKIMMKNRKNLKNLIILNSKIGNLEDALAADIDGKNNDENKYTPVSKSTKFFARALHPMQYGSLRGSIFSLTSMCLGAGSMVLAKRCQQLGLVNFIILLILGALIVYGV